MTPQDRAAGLTRNIPWVRRDTHGWWVCEWCQATCSEIKIEIPEAERKPGYPVAILRPAVEPFPHTADCAYLALTARIADAIRAAIIEERKACAVTAKAAGCGDWQMADTNDTEANTTKRIVATILARTDS